MTLSYVHVHNPQHKIAVWTAHRPWTKVAVGFLIGWLIHHRTNLCHESHATTTQMGEVQQQHVHSSTAHAENKLL